MTREEAASCINTIVILKNLCYRVRGLMDVIDAQNCDKIIEMLNMSIHGALWVPCSKWLPEEGREVLGTDTYGRVRHVIKDKCGENEFATYEEMMHIPIVAWTLLPDPYQRGEKND